MLDNITYAQIDAMRSDDMAGAFPRPEGMRTDGTLIVGLPYSIRASAQAYDWRAITPDGRILPDSVYSWRSGGFIPSPRSA